MGRRQEDAVRLEEGNVYNYVLLRWSVWDIVVRHVWPPTKKDCTERLSGSPQRGRKEEKRPKDLLAVGHE